ncbi:terpenoid synthase [Wolfiporia cocos MD-104 SS10]|uniref:Terpenoid synthase n=1 Tax=Wolfiporia cocos (strain MD-104) TaxID=742152 RepID=A0A2H3J028_WOLCO|nr:terpenoid synthase [Wolfiporia cocos MD-104 SS10]
MDLPDNNVELLKDTSRKAVNDLMAKLGFTYTPIARDYALESRVREIVDKWDVKDLIHPYIPLGILAATVCYGYTMNKDTQAQIALFVALFLALDTPSIMESTAAVHVHKQLCSSVPNKHDVMGHFLDCTRGMSEYFLPFASTSILTSVLQFVNGCYLEQNAQEWVAQGPNPLSFIDYQRNLTGIAEAHAYFIWPKENFPELTDYVQAIPDSSDICLFQCYVNDILSYYKEELNGETGNYIDERAASTGKTTSEVLSDIVDETTVVVERIRRILGEGASREAWEVFMHGNILYHIGTPRYRLQDVIDCEYLSFES